MSFLSTIVIPAPLAESTLLPHPMIMSVPLPFLNALVASPKSATLSLPDAVSVETSTVVSLTLYLPTSVSSPVTPKYVFKLFSKPAVKAVTSSAVTHE